MNIIFYSMAALITAGLIAYNSLDFDGGGAQQQQFAEAKKTLAIKGIPPKTVAPEKESKKEEAEDTEDMPAQKADITVKTKQFTSKSTANGISEKKETIIPAISNNEKKLVPVSKKERNELGKNPEVVWNESAPLPKKDVSEQQKTEPNILKEEKSPMLDIAQRKVPSQSPNQIPKEEAAIPALKEESEDNPNKRLGIKYSMGYDYGFFYQTEFLENYYVKGYIGGWRDLGNSNNYDDTEANIGIEFQRNLIKYSDIRLYALVGFNLFYLEHISTEYGKDYYKTSVYKRDFKLSPGIGIETVLWNHFSISIDGMYYFQSGNRNLYFSDGKTIDFRQQFSKESGLGVSFAVSYAWN